MSKSDFKILLAGISAFIVAIGTARFAFTALLPQMLSDFLSVEQASFLAFSNYLGYFIGSMIGLFSRSSNLKIILFKTALFISILTTFVLAFDSHFIFWFNARLFAGIGSALIMTIGSSLVFDLLIHNKQAMGFYFTGVGISIVLTSLISDIVLSFSHWKTAWIVLILFSIPLCFYAISILTKGVKNSSPNQGNKSEKLPNLLIIKILIIAYLLEGIGFVVQASFMPDIINKIPKLAGLGGYAWYLVGIFAIFGPILWINMAKKFGNENAIIAALLLQTVGILIPVVSDNLILNLSSGAIYGNTMMGLTALFMNYGARIAPKSSTATMGALTAAYSIGTIIAPLYCAKLFSLYQSYNPALLLTAFFVMISAVLVIWVKVKSFQAA